MKVAFDTNILVRLFVADDALQLEAARGVLRDAETIAVPIVALCEAVWVMRKAYKLPFAEVADHLDLFLADERVRYDRTLAAGGIALLRAGGDFADAVIAADGRRLGADRLVTFDQQAARLLEQTGELVLLLDAAAPNR
ncbi:type II toxin-antitoxin system VapC family toxin [Sphingomonas radiodurans]|uniref:type II toxin-antitoxin system VapC family toxin n=1 Tax=Sphingomonas radiodurans TaxID=2890321 RepID=UPI001E3ECAB7|nr:type II toxin-antitoxin system VapC family toxin [Sphingomonas radiodurans]WBH17266.1 type II toxin-antitoxin system VapC family toxin [Sphingomonas radiodurans]